MVFFLLFFLFNKMQRPKPMNPDRPNSKIFKYRIIFSCDDGCVTELQKRIKNLGKRILLRFFEDRMLY